MQVHTDHYSEPDHIYAEMLCGRREQGQYDEGDLEEVDEKAQDEDSEVAGDQEAKIIPPGRLVRKLSNPKVPVETPEDQTEGS